MAACCSIKCDFGAERSIKSGFSGLSYTNSSVYIPRRISFSTGYARTVLLVRFWEPAARLGSYVTSHLGISREQGCALDLEAV